MQIVGPEISASGVPLEACDRGGADRKVEHYRSTNQISSGTRGRKDQRPLIIDQPVEKILISIPRYAEVCRGSQGARELRRIGERSDIELVEESAQVIGDENNRFSIDHRCCIGQLTGVGTGLHETGAEGRVRQRTGHLSFDESG